MEDRKKAHIDLAFQSQLGIENQDQRFIYEPLLASHEENFNFHFKIAGKELRSPIWASSMTGGTKLASKINTNIAKNCRKYGMGMGLGSCRIILKEDTHLKDFDVRDHIGENLPLFANLGIAQIENLLQSGDEKLIDELLHKLRADGLIVHVNPIQEWLQPEGNKITKAPIETIKTLIDQADYPIIVKEVGQGMGKNSLRSLMELPFEAIEFAAFGGTNFALLEMLRTNEDLKQAFQGLANIGQNSYQMLNDINELINLSSDSIKTKKLIISGGIKSFLDGYFLCESSRLPAIYGMASSILKYAQESEEELDKFLKYQHQGLQLAKNYLKINPDFIK